MRWGGWSVCVSSTRGAYGSGGIRKGQALVLCIRRGNEGNEVVGLAYWSWNFSVFTTVTHGTCILIFGTRWAFGWAGSACVNSF